MARLKTVGWETGLIDEDGGVSSANGGSVGLVTSNPSARTGTYALKCTSIPVFSGHAFARRRITLPSTYTELWWRLLVFPQIASHETAIFKTLDSGGNAQMTLTLDHITGLLRAYRGDRTTLLATSGVAVSNNAWTVLQIRHKVSDTVGVIEVWVTGVQTINFSGDTQQSGTANIKSFDLQAYRYTDAFGTSNSACAFDDVAVNDTTGSRNNAKPNDGRVFYLVPTSAGDVTQLARGGTDSGANWSQVDEVPIGTSDDVRSDVDGQYDLYSLANTTVAGDVAAAVWTAYAQKSDAGLAGIAPMLKTGGTESEGSRVELATGNAFYQQIYEVNPVTSNPWTTSELDALQAGVKVKA